DNRRMPLQVVLILLVGCQVVCGNSLFPYGKQHGDNAAERTEDDYIIKLPHTIYFTGMRYKELHVSPFGSLGFRRQVFHYTDWDAGRDLETKDPPFIAPLYFNSIFSADPTPRQGEGIFYRIVSDTKTKNDVTDLIRMYMVGAEQFNASIVVIVTWAGIRKEIQGTGPKNTFQLILAADDNDTYAMFNYKEVHPQSEFYHAGINAGNFRGWTSVIPVKNSSALAALPYVKALDVPGRFLFRVSSDQPERGGCTNTTGRSRLTLLRRYVGMFGGEVLEVSGQCLEENTTAECLFGDISGKIREKTKGVVINKAKLNCPVPRFLFRGESSVTVKLDNDESTKLHANMHIALPQLMPTTVVLENPENWDKMNQNHLTIRWDPTLLSLNNAATVSINLIGYMEKRNEFQYKKLATIKENHRLYSGFLQFDPKRFSCSGHNCDYEVGLIEVKLENFSDVNSYWFLSSEVIPLGWYISPGLTRELGTGWAKNKCELMKSDTRHNNDWLDHLFPCPCNLNQALADFGRWLTEPGCNSFRKTRCRFHEEAIHCVKSVAPTKRAAGNQCCYRKDGSLIYSMDSHYGSTPDKADVIGVYPYLKVNHVPVLSHWVWDVIPFYHCCKWSDNCRLYMKYRPTVNCAHYKPPATSVLFGDPHAITFDKANFTMQLLGMYWLLKSKDSMFQLQGDFDQSLNIAAHVSQKFSTLVAVALRSEQENHVEVRMRHPYTEEYVLDISVNNEYIHFNNLTGYTKVFRKVVIIDNSLNGKQDKITIVTGSGIGVHVSANYGMMQLAIVAPPELKNQLDGLLGSWNGNKDDDKPQNTTVWAVLDKKKSLFMHYRPTDTSFAGGKVENISCPPDADYICGKGPYNAFCKYDYTVTGNKNIAKNSRNIIDIYESLSHSQITRKTCGHLDVKNSVIDHFNYTVGNTVKITKCEKDYYLKGHKAYKCVMNKDNGIPEWTPRVNSKCSHRKKEVKRIAAILGAVVGFIVLVAIIVGIICCCKNKSSKKQKRSVVYEKREGEKMLRPLEETVEVRDA
ncbi:hypothetical protein Ahia01_000448500, partial [Argonauta hians]